MTQPKSSQVSRTISSCIARRHCSVSSRAARMVRGAVGPSGNRLQCGFTTISWGTFYTAITAVLDSSAVYSAGLLGAQACERRINLVRSVIMFALKGFRLTNLRRQIHNSKCGDSRDRIYTTLDPRCSMMLKLTSCQTLLGLDCVIWRQELGSAAARAVSYDDYFSFASQLGTRLVILFTV